MAAGLYLGVDLGATSIKLGVCTAAGEIQGRARIPTHPARGAGAALARIHAAAETLMQTTGWAVSCGLGVPGPLDARRSILIRGANLPGWINVPIAQLLGEKLGMPTYLENDANCAAWGEYRVGIGRNAGSLVMFTLGTGIGGGIILHGDLWIGIGGGAGRLGHVAVHPDSPRCNCGQTGCLEQYASARAVARSYGRGTAEDVFNAARSGEPAALEVVGRASDALALGIASVIQILQPEIVVLGGGMAAAGDLLLGQVRAEVRRRVIGSLLERVRIELSALAGDAGWIGAALWAQRQGSLDP